MISRRGHCLLWNCIGVGRKPCMPDNTADLARRNAKRPISIFHAPARIIQPARTETLSSSYLRLKRLHILQSHHKKNNFSSFTKSAYVHPLSQIVLEHLQSHHGPWVAEMGLDTGLKLNKDGTFVLRFPGADGDDSVAAEDMEGEEADGHNESIRNGSIWTLYEPTEKKHYLCVTKGSLVGRYMLQDNTKPAWHSDKRSTPERVQDAVDEMIEKMQEIGISAGKS
mmetsp:Transcript_12035/g.20878  ORF Transcript_12035/g.20878 Transcript_12035/m.20878 type:complete len:225 (+) Transcript_12035:24-698(+)